MYGLKIRVLLSPPPPRCNIILLSAGVGIKPSSTVYPLALRPDADVFAYYAETRFDTLCWYYARGFRHIIPALCRNFLKRRAWRDDDPKDEEYSEPVLEFPSIWVRRRCNDNYERTSIGIPYYSGGDEDTMTTMTKNISNTYLILWPSGQTQVALHR